jgi:hypothetical protein
MVCAGCLKKLAGMPLTRRPGFVNTLRALQLAVGAVTVSVFFYWTGQTLLRLPSSFHDGTVWRGTWLNNP